jgi:hypothetical protein
MRYSALAGIARPRAEKIGEVLMGPLPGIMHGDNRRGAAPDQGEALGIPQASRLEARRSGCRSGACVRGRASARRTAIASRETEQQDEGDSRWQDLESHIPFRKAVKYSSPAGIRFPEANLL